MHQQGFLISDPDLLRKVDIVNVLLDWTPQTMGGLYIPRETTTIVLMAVNRCSLAVCTVYRLVIICRRSLCMILT